MSISSRTFFLFANIWFYIGLWYLTIKWTFLHTPWAYMCIWVGSELGTTKLVPRSSIIPSIFRDCNANILDTIFLNNYVCDLWFLDRNSCDLWLLDHNSWDLKFIDRHNYDLRFLDHNNCDFWFLDRNKCDLELLDRNSSDLWFMDRKNCDLCDIYLILFVLYHRQISFANISI